MASWEGVPILLQEQNSFAGVTNRLLGQKASSICVAYENMDRFFDARKIKLTGNPVRQDILKTIDKVDARKELGLLPNKKTILIVGGSLGARTINQAIAQGLVLYAKSDVQVIWQTGKIYFSDMVKLKSQIEAPNVHVFEFVSRMDLAYAASDVVVSRAGAGTISELCLLGKPSILVPSPNVSEDHQTKNAMALVQKNAAVLVKDTDAKQNLVSLSIELVCSSEKCTALSEAISSMALHQSAQRIADEIFSLIKN
jgi:UDP-N-acetylglucosamine--N-acetylmuramyl-(pentapeptide) pyrophosphoryl-undecaprenol N-acetylglucosamine transferase